MPTKEAWKRLHAIEGLVKMDQPQTGWNTGPRNVERDAAIVAALRKGMPYDEAAAKWELSPQRIGQIAAREGVDGMAPIRARQQQRRAQIEAAIRNKEPIEQVARRFGVSQARIRQLVPDWAAYAQPKTVKPRNPGKPRNPVETRAKQRMAALARWADIPREERIRILQDRGIWRGKAGTDDNPNR